MPSFAEILSGGDLRSIGASDEIAAQIRTQQAFDDLFACLRHPDRRVVMRAADALEKVSRPHPEFLEPHRQALLGLSETAVDKELVWHLAQLLSRITWQDTDLQKCRRLLAAWASARDGSRIVRVNALQGLFDLAMRHPEGIPELELLLEALENEGVPSLAARVRKLWALLKK